MDVHTSSGPSQFVRALSLIGFLTVLGLIISLNLTQSPDGGLTLVLLLFILLPAIVLAFTDSKFLVTYILAVWAFAPEVRRVVDWQAGEFHSLSVLSLAPLLVTALLLVPLKRHPPTLTRPVRRALQGLGLALFYGLVIGSLHNGFAVFYDLAGYVLPMLLFLYLISCRITSQQRDNYIASFVTVAVVVAVYGWIQYLFAPAWDTFWMRSTAMVTNGLPEPLKIRVFSTLNSPLPAGIFLATALAAMVVERRWRGMFGGLGILLVASALALTLVRSAWLMLIVMILVYTIRSSKKHRLQAVSGTIIGSLTLFFLVPLLPGGKTVTERVQTIGTLHQDNSYQARSEFAFDFLPVIMSKPAGMGLGTVGLGSKVETNGKGDALVNFDNGYWAILITFGLVGGFLVFRALYLLGMSITVVKAVEARPYASFGVAVLWSVVFGLTSVNILSNVGGVIIWFMLGLGTCPIRQTSEGASSP